ncbi:MAG: O-antigen ligase family protein [Cyclobacteriaceae bacterium]
MLPILLFLVYLGNVVRADDLAEGLRQVEKRILLLVFPVILFLLDGRLRSIDRISVFRSFALLILIVSVICYVKAALNVVENNSFKVVTLTERDYYYFSYLYLVSPTSLDPIYMSLYVNLCIIYLLFMETTRRITIKYAVLMYLGVFVVLIASKIGIAFMLLTFLIKSVSEVFKRTISNKQKIVLLLIPIFIGSTLFIPFIKERLWQSLDYNYNWDYSGSWNSTNQRLAIWSSAKEAVVNSPLLGYGTSNGQLELEKIYKKNGYIRGHEDHYNAHNEYIHLTLEAGILGLLILILVLIYPLLKSLKHEPLFPMVFLLMMALYFMVEVILARQKGISFFACFYCLTFVNVKE